MLVIYEQYKSSVFVILGPVLFLIFVNDIVDIFGSGLTGKFFADDVKIYAIINYVIDSVLLQEGSDALYTWSYLWQHCPFLYKMHYFRS